MKKNAYMLINSNEVAKAHDTMAAEYDQLKDLWYPWLFSQMHEFIVKHLPPAGRRRRLALDAGCGTGLQSFLLAQAGYSVEGIDISTKLVEAAIAKIPSQAVPSAQAAPLFAAPNWNRAQEHTQELARDLEHIRNGLPVTPPSFAMADLKSFNYAPGRYDVITCCGSVMSFIDDYPKVISKMAGALKPGGRLLLEIEQKVNLDLLWPFVDILFSGRLSYEQTLSEASKNLFASWGRPVRVDYPFELASGETVNLPIIVFSISELEKTFDKAGLVVRDKMGIHSITNLIPSTMLHQPEPGKVLSALTHFLMSIEKKLSRYWPIWRLGCSVIYCLERKVE
jgi:MPBQ/MSBQ methyltransferase